MCPRTKHLNWANTRQVVRRLPHAATNQRYVDSCPISQQAPTSRGTELSRGVKRGFVNKTAPRSALGGERSFDAPIDDSLLPGKISAIRGPDPHNRLPKAIRLHLCREGYAEAWQWSPLARIEARTRAKCKTGCGESCNRGLGGLGVRAARVCSRVGGLWKG